MSSDQQQKMFSYFVSEYNREVGDYLQLYMDDNEHVTGRFETRAGLIIVYQLFKQSLKITAATTHRSIISNYVSVYDLTSAGKKLLAPPLHITALGKNMQVIDELKEGINTAPLNIVAEHEFLVPTQTVPFCFDLKYKDCWQ